MIDLVLNRSKILLPRFDTHGDHVLFSGFIAALADKFPEAIITILVRKGYDQLAPLLPSKIRWITTTIMPYGPFRSSDEPELMRLLDSLSAEKFDLLLATTYNRTWLEEIIAAKLSGVKRIALGEPREIPDEVMRIAGSNELNIDRSYDQLIDVDEWAHETTKYQQFWDVLFSDDLRRLPDPYLEVSVKLREEALESLAELGLTPRDFFVCAPAGTQNVSIKSWPKDYFAEVIVWVQRKYALKPLLIGHEREADLLEAVVDLVKDLGGSAQIWVGRDGNFAQMTAIIQQSRFYCGNDTGPLHVAAAVGIPVIGIYGGGTWPRFTPTGSDSMAVVGDMDCFGCYWGCVYGDGRCMQLVGVEDAKRAVTAVIQRDTPKFNGVILTKRYSERNIDIVNRSWFLQMIRRIKNRCVRISE